MILLLAELEVLVNAKVGHIVIFCIELETFLSLLKVVHKQLKIEPFILDLSSSYFEKTDVTMQI